jgi:hypothetical protein
MGPIFLKTRTRPIRCPSPGVRSLPNSERSYFSAEASTRVRIEALSLSDNDGHSAISRCRSSGRASPVMLMLCSCCAFIVFFGRPALV